MSEETLDDQKTEFALAIARGKSVSTWAQQNGVGRSTAFRWAAEPEVRNIVKAWRRHSIDRALGRMAGRATKAVEEIAKLAAQSDCDAVRLRAWRAILSDQIAVAKFSVLEQRMTEIEEDIETEKGNRPPTG
jgi:hypothetical protein